MWDSHQKLADIKKESYDAFTKLDSLPHEAERCLGAVMMVMNKDRSFWSIKKEVTDPQFSFRVMQVNIEKVKPETIVKIREHVNIEGFNVKSLAQ